jgi:hypothetical protein
LLAVFGTLVWLVLNGLLWYARPSDLQWLFGSLILVIAYGYRFFWYVTRPK